MIKVQDLTKEFSDLKRGAVAAVDNVSFEVNPGEIFGLLGPNGAGKTTCLRILSTVLKPTAGQALVAGYDVARFPESVRANIGFMSCNTGIYDRMTAREMVEYYGRLYGIEEEPLQARIEEIFETLQMNEIRDVLGLKMSTGMKQKVSIARTIIHDPPVLIFDEPTSGLDVLVARAVLEAVSALRDIGKCIIFSTHIMREVEKLCDRVAIIHKGQILDTGTVSELISKYDQPDIEEVFFQLIHEREPQLSLKASGMGTAV
ncbi:ATP-binding cassette domain-containing protein [bacterium]|jgi:sodium transport system ATP-binding protein|nr:ATP-binding cassette domain-containing protein [Planctomicrobium sp.]MDB4793213.1 ATP-binding cassette domain-containing protein [bacterium]